jgi:AcrR family transcriptional regulator
MSNSKNNYEKLIAAASECFANKGFFETSIKEISKLANISQGSMYTYFKSKDELIAAIVHEEQTIALNFYDDEFNCSSLQRIYDIISLSINYKMFNDKHNRLWLEIMAESSKNDYLRECYVSSDVVMRNGLKKIIESGVDSGEFRPGIDLEETSLVLFALLDGLVCKKAINPNFELEKDMPDFILTLKKILS